MIVANHLSFLDPILLLLFARQKTVVKKTYFRVPVFGWNLKKLRLHCPALAGDSGSDILLEQVGR